MRNNCAFLWSFTYVTKLTTYMPPHIHKRPPDAHNTTQHTRVVLHVMILPHKYLHKLPPDDHHTPLHPRTIIHTKILSCRPFTHTIKFYINKNCHNIKTYQVYITISHKCWFGTTYPTIHGSQNWICAFSTWRHPDVHKTSYTQTYYVAGHGSPSKETYTQQRVIIW